MNKLVLQKATKILKPLKGFLFGPTGSGKTYSSLLLASGIVQAQRGCSEEESFQHIVLIDTESGRGALHAGLGEYNYVEIKAPYNTEKLVNYITELNAMDDIDVIIIDSLTHFWSKKGGILDQKTAYDLTSKTNSYTNWSIFTTKFNEMIDIILESPKHVLMTARAKSDTVLVANDKGKFEPRTYGLKPEMRDGFEYECDITFNVDKQTHELFVEKGIPGMSVVYTPATSDLGKLIYQLHIDKAVVKVRTIDEIAESIRELSRTYNLIQFVQLQLSGRKLNELDMDTILELEQKLLTEIRLGQSKR